jgi:hypothetical protein
MRATIERLLTRPPARTPDGNWSTVELCCGHPRRPPHGIYSAFAALTTVPQVCVRCAEIPHPITNRAAWEARGRGRVRTKQGRS